ncbi:hypothetical protein EJ04DRAFT_101640 [Polyplosphaeria fusca]|uniref:FAD-binding FR-type domain-containing protein n=1 Tax=Polyplosphaeria fusca TaxID=682080 RepID=A0A9P4QJB5_9PLEO|nr:hypothetical protein EJ04DRAFT_101640 [Polyplosphaeria fusca]
MPLFQSSLLRPRPGVLIVLGTSVLGGAAYRFAKPSSTPEGSLNPHTFTGYALISKQYVSPTSAIFTLRDHDGASDLESVKEVWKRSVWSVQVKQPQLQIARAYTPLPATERRRKDNTVAPDDIQLLIRQEDRGEVSTYLHRLPQQATIEVRGPNVECELPHDIKEVIFLAGGTGIAPAMQVASALARRTDSRMDILWANRRRSECAGGVSDDKNIQSDKKQRLGLWQSFWGPADEGTEEQPIDSYSGQTKGILVLELEALKERSKAHAKGLSVQYYVDEENTFIQPGDIVKRLKPNSQEDQGSRVILVSGPVGFIEHYAGKKVWVGGQETQGPLGGVLGQMDLKGWTVVKL